MAQHVTIMRKWNYPQIFINITDDEINISMPLEAFMQAVKTEIGSVTWTFSKETFNSNFNNAVGKVVSSMKRETTKVIG